MVDQEEVAGESRFKGTLMFTSTSALQHTAREARPGTREQLRPRLEHQDRIVSGSSPRRFISPVRNPTRIYFARLPDAAAVLALIGRIPLRRPRVDSGAAEVGAVQFRMISPP